MLLLLCKAEMMQVCTRPQVRPGGCCQLLSFFILPFKKKKYITNFRDKATDHLLGITLFK